MPPVYQHAKHSIEHIGTTGLGLATGLAPPDSDGSALGGELHGHMEKEKSGQPPPTSQQDL